MPLRAPRLLDLAREFAVFPLEGTLLLPHVKLPLTIFEPRYLALVEDALGEGRMFGMVQPDGSRAGGPNGPALFGVGCLGRLVAFSETDDGRYLITLAGLIRFRLEEELVPRRGYRRVHVNFASFAADLDAPENPAIEREKLFRALRAFLSARGLNADWKALEALGDDAVVPTLSIICPFAATEKQALLEAPTEASRAATLLALLEMNAYAGPEGGEPPRLAS